MPIVSTSSANQRSQTHYVLTDTGYREREAWLDEVPAHVAAFLAAGGTIKQIPASVSAYKPSADHMVPFVINNHVGAREMRPRNRKRTKPGKAQGAPIATGAES